MKCCSSVDCPRGPFAVPRCRTSATTTRCRTSTPQDLGLLRLYPTLAMTADHNASSSGASSEPPEPESFDYYKKWWKDKEPAQTSPAPEKFEFYQKWSSA
eukprot:12466131-Heterocapsa_arctica.AAC.1